MPVAPLLSECAAQAAQLALCSVAGRGRSELAKYLLDLGIPVDCCDEVLPFAECASGRDGSCMSDAARGSLDSQLL
jgi:hypothetical protein